MRDSDLTARGCRIAAALLGAAYMLLPTMHQGLTRLPIHFGEVFHVLFGPVRLAMGGIGLVCLILSLTLPEGRDWRAVDRVWAAPVGISAVLWAVYVALSLNDPPVLYTAETQRIIWCVLAGYGVLLAITTGLLLTRAWLAIVPLAVLMVFWSGLLSPWLAPDNPKYLAEQEKLERTSAFGEYLDDEFWQGFVRTGSPEEVKRAFAWVQGDARTALDEAIGEEAARALLEDGDDKVFLETYYGHLRRNEAGALENNPEAVSVRVVHHAGSVVSPSSFKADRWFWYPLLAYVLFRAGMAWLGRRLAAIDP